MKLQLGVWGRFWRDQEGNVAVEYAGILALVLGASVAALGFINQGAGDLLEVIGNSSPAYADDLTANDTTLAATAEETTPTEDVVTTATSTVTTTTSGTSSGNGKGNGNGKGKK